MRHERSCFAAIHAPANDQCDAKVFSSIRAHSGPSFRNTRVPLCACRCTRVRGDLNLANRLAWHRDRDARSGGSVRNSHRVRTCRKPRATDRACRRISEDDRAIAGHSGFFRTWLSRLVKLFVPSWSISTAIRDASTKRGNRSNTSSAPERMLAAWLSG
jgi:hypothetical protein